MENLDDQINRLETLLAGLHIEEQPSDEEIDEGNEVVLDYSSDENPYEEQPYFVKAEDEAENSNKKRTHTETEYDDIRFREYLREQGYMLANDKLRRVPTEFKPREKLDYKLNLDCVKDKMKVFLDWKNELELQLKLNSKLEELTGADTLSYITLQTTGIVHWYLAYLDPKTKEKILETGDKTHIFHNTISLIARQFLGKELNTGLGLEAIRKENFWKIMNLKICNMCYLENYICEFQKYYYLLDDSRKTIVDSVFYSKLPYDVGQEVEKTYQEMVNLQQCPETLGGKIDVLNQWVKEKCKQERSRKQAQIKLCCSKNDDVGNYGCSKKVKRFKKPKRKWKKVPYEKYKRQKYKPKFFRKRKQYKQKYMDKSKTCPTGKKTCKCWLCNEEGHYANRCPKKNEGKSKTETLRIAYDLGFEPIEDFMSDSDISIYGYETETDSE